MRRNTVSLFLVLLFAGPVWGQGITGSIHVSPSRLTFGTQLVGIPSVPQLVTIKNARKAVVNLARLRATGDFSQTNTCAGTLAENVSCTISIIFTPIAKGTRRGAIVISMDPAATTPLVHLSGVGTVVEFTPDALSFEPQLLGLRSRLQVITVTNIGPAPLRIAAIRIVPAGERWGKRDLYPNSRWRTSQFSETNDCGDSVGSGASCTISVTFIPRKVRSASDWLILNDDGGGAPHKVPLSGTASLQPLARQVR